MLSVRRLLKGQLNIEMGTEHRTVDTLRQYLERAADIIGERTADEEKYDREVLRWLEKGKPIKKALAKANEKYPTEALRVEETELGEVQAHYEYLLNHERMMRKVNR